MEETIISICDESKNVKKELVTIIQNFNESLRDLDNTVLELNNEMKTADSSDVHELREYKSELLQIKTDVNNQLRDTKKMLSALEETIAVYEKIIQLKTGDIF